MPQHFLVSGLYNIPYTPANVCSAVRDLLSEKVYVNRARMCARRHTHTCDDTPTPTRAHELRDRTRQPPAGRCRRLAYVTRRSECVRFFLCGYVLCLVGNQFRSVCAWALLWLPTADAAGAAAGARVCARVCARNRAYLHVHYFRPFAQAICSSCSLCASPSFHEYL